MRRYAWRSVWRGLAASVAAGLLACGLLGALVGALTPAGELATARQRWSARVFSRYRLVVDEQTRAGSCRQELQIDNERIVGVLQNHCVRVPSWTVSNLFTWVSGLNDGAARCYPSAVACVCHAIYSARASFDPQLGYPRQVTYRWDLQTNWGYAGHWERLLRVHELPSCEQVTRRAGGYIVVKVVALTPLP